MTKTPKKTKMSAKNIAAGFLMALLGLSLLGFGVEGFGGRTTTIGSVGDRKITTSEFSRALQNELRALQSQFGQAITMEQARLFGIDQMVLEQLVTGAVLDNEAERLGVSAGDTIIQSEITQIPSFRGLDGNFDRESYRFALRNAGMTEREFEDSIRNDVARSILQRAVVSGSTAPANIVTPLLEFQAQTRDMTVITLSGENLPSPIGQPDQAALEAFYSENIENYTLPEGKRIRYAWITPEMMVDEIDVDDAVLRQAYDSRLSEFSQPERRLVERLVFSDQASAEAAIARINSGEITFEGLVAERGLDLDDTDMGDVTRADLGAAADLVFDLAAPGIVGPAQTSLGPAIFRMNAILAAQETSFEEVRDQLRDEQFSDLARRALLDDLDLFEDLIAGGASVTELAQETRMQLGEIEWRPGETTGIAAYESFRNAAETLQAGDFPEITQMADGGLFVLEFVETLPAAPRPLEEVRFQVISEWRNARTLEGLLDLAEEVAQSLRDGTAGPDIALTPIRFDALRRSDIMPDLPRNLVAAGFEMEPGDVRIVEGTGRLHLVQLHDVQSADLMLDDIAILRGALEQQIEQSIAQDLFGYFSASLRQSTPIQINQQVIDAVQAGL
ncbi:MAG: SurA N-terminal domain-containing protein [Roseinatronobacter sp.]